MRRKSAKTLTIADLFCGAGGTSTGALDAAELLGYRTKLTAINHWDNAIATHAANHPDAQHLLTAIDNVNPRDLYAPGELDLLWASPECTHHSVARGGKPINEQSRATAWCVVRWADAVQPTVILVENVPEFISWGGIGADQRPLKSKRGETFAAWIKALESLGYRVGWRVLCAADYGDPTTRKRLFIQAVRGKRKIVWPEPSHCRVVTPDLFTLQRPWVAAREIIDWSLQGGSIYDRKRPLSDKTMRRIMTGLQKFGLRPFIVPQTGDGTRSVDTPAPAVTTTSRGVRLVQPRAYLVNMKGRSNASDIEAPVPTVTAHAPHLHVAEPSLERVVEVWKQTCNCGREFEGTLEQSCPGCGRIDSGMTHGDPFLVNMHGTTDSHLDAAAQSVDDPLRTVSAGGINAALAQPFLVPNFGEREGQKPRCHSVDEPMPAVTASGHIAVAQPFLVQLAHGESAGEKNAENRRVRSVDDPVPTIHAQGGSVGLCEPSLSRVQSVDEPLPTVCGNRGDVALIEPHLLPQNGGGALRSVDEPSPTVACDGAIGLVEPFLIKYYGTNKGGQSISDPLDTVTAKERHALVEPALHYRPGHEPAPRPVVVIQGQSYILDIRFRMLQPHELAGAQGFPRDYKFTGNKTEKVKLIGNAVPCRLARAIVYAVLSQSSDCDQLLTAE